MFKKLIPFVIAALLTLSACSEFFDTSDSSKAIDLQENAFSGYGYYYNQLEDDVKDIYMELYKAVKDFKDVAELSYADEKETDTAIYALGCDHPEFFWLSSGTTIEYNDDDTVASVEFELPKDVEDTYDEIESIAADIVTEMPSTYTDYEKFKYLYEWVINNVDYKSGDQDQDIRSVFLEHESVCAGYSCAYQYLCSLSGLDCTYVGGIVTENEPHAWNLVMLEDEYYWVDVTWGDPVYDEDSENETDTIDYDFFLVSDKDMVSSHTPDKEIYYGDDNLGEDVFTFPECTSDKYNYYILNDSYFETYDQSEIDSFIIDKIDSDTESDVIIIEFKIADKDEWDIAYDDVIGDEDESHIDDVIDEYFESVESEYEFSYSVEKSYSEDSLTFEIDVAVSYE